MIKRYWLIFVVLPFVIAGCASIPTSGPVTEVVDDGELGQSTAHYSPTGPVDGATPQSIVHGFLDAMLAYPVSHRVAASFLTPEAAEQWRPTSGITVYADPRTGTAAGTEERQNVPVTFQILSALDSQGHLAYRDDQVTEDWELELVDDQWRIAGPPDGAMVTRSYFEDYFRPFNLYFLNSAGTGLVADPVFAPVGDQLATTLATALAIGPENAFAASVETMVPPVETLRTTVPIDDSVAEVQFDADLTELSAAEQGQLAAQLAWTLSSVPDVESVRILSADGVLAPRDSSLQSTTSWQGFAPRNDRQAVTLLTADGAVLADRLEVSPAPGAWGEDIQGAAGVLMGPRIAAAWDDDTLQVTRTNGVVLHSYPVEQILDPVFDNSERVWVVDSESDMVLVADEDNGFTQVSAPGLNLASLTSFAISPDGGRYVAVSQVDDQATVLVGPVISAESLSLGRPREIPVAVQQPASVRWLDSTRISMLGRVGSSAQVYTTRIDGSAGGTTVGGIAARLGDIAAIDIATVAGPEAQLFVLDSSGGIHTVVGTNWQQLDVAEVFNLN